MKEELIKIFEGADKKVLTVVSPLFDELEYVESQLIELKKYPLVKFHPENPTLQKPTVSGRMYDRLLSQKKDIIRVLCMQLNKSNETGEGDSPLRKYFRELEFR